MRGCGLGTNRKRKQTRDTMAKILRSIPMARISCPQAISWFSKTIEYVALAVNVVKKQDD